MNTIDTGTQQLSNLIPGDQWFPLSISADKNELLVADKDAIQPIDLDSLQLLPKRPYVLDVGPILEGLDGRDYTFDSINGAYQAAQFDRDTGEIEALFGYNLSGEMLMSLDEKALVFNGELATDSYDISTPTPTLLNHVGGVYSSLALSPDGKYLYGRNGTDNKLFRADMPGLSSFQDLFPLANYYGPPDISPAGLIYEFTPLANDGVEPGHVQVYDPVSLFKTADVDLSDINPPSYDTPGFRFYNPVRSILDHTGEHLFVVVDSTSRASETVEEEVWEFATAGLSVPRNLPAKNLLNISTRGDVKSGEEAMIGGFIVQGTKPKRVVVRGLGPSLPITGAMDDPVLELYDSAGKLIASNDNWTENRIAVLATTLASTSPREAVIPITLAPGSYTAVVHDRANQPGLALIEVYDLDPADSLLANHIDPRRRRHGQRHHDRRFHHRRLGTDPGARARSWTVAVRGGNKAAFGLDPSERARGYEVQIALDPMAGPWVTYDTFTSSRGIILTGQPRAKDIWVRVRAIGPNNTKSGWSDPATILVS
jgi:hypothetical protein